MTSQSLQSFMQLNLVFVNGGGGKSSKYGSTSDGQDQNCLQVTHQKDIYSLGYVTSEIQPNNSQESSSSGGGGSST